MYLGIDRFVALIFMLYFKTVFTMTPPNLFRINFMLKWMSSRGTAEYDGYGCWCESVYAGKPVDAVDRCCKDWRYCYEKVARDLNCTDSALLYSYTSCPGRIDCDSKETCKAAICNCDVITIECLITNDNEYNPNYLLNDHERDKYCTGYSVH